MHKLLNDEGRLKSKQAKSTVADIRARDMGTEMFNPSNRRIEPTSDLRTHTFDFSKQVVNGTLVA